MHAESDVVKLSCEQATLELAILELRRERNELELEVWHSPSSWQDRAVLGQTEWNAWSRNSRYDP